MTVRRRIIFSAWADANPKKPFDLQAALDEIIPLTDSDTILVQNEALTACVVLEKGDGGEDPALIQVLALRDYENRPTEWGPGTQPTPIIIGEDRYTADITHVAIWPDKIAAHDAYSTAPGLGRLSAYFRDKGKQKVVFRPLYDPNLADQLEDIKGFRRFEYGIHSPAKVQQAKSSDFLGDLLPGAFGDKVPSISVSLGMSRKSPRDAYLDESVSDAMLTAAENAEQFFDTLAIYGKSKTQKTKAGNAKTVKLNLLKHRIQVEGQEIARDESGGNLPGPDAVYEALIGARKAVTDERLASAVEARTVIDMVEAAAEDEE